MSIRLSFADLWQQQELSDVNLQLQAPAEQDSTASQPEIIKTIPAHKVLLSISPYFKPRCGREAPFAVSYVTACLTCPLSCLQIQRWQQQLSSSSAAADDGSHQKSMPTVTLTLEAAADEAAAMVVLEAMYGADPDIVLSSTQPSLTQHLQAIVLADMLQVSSIVDALVQRLVIACRQQVETASQVALLMQSHSQLPEHCGPCCLYCSNSMSNMAPSQNGFERTSCANCSWIPMGTWTQRGRTIEPRRWPCHCDQCCSCWQQMSCRWVRSSCPHAHAAGCARLPGMQYE